MKGGKWPWISFVCPAIGQIIFRAHLWFAVASFLLLNLFLFAPFVWVTVFRRVRVDSFFPVCFFSPSGVSFPENKFYRGEPLSGEASSEAHRGLYKSVRDKSRNKTERHSGSTGHVKPSREGFEREIWCEKVRLRRRAGVPHQAAALLLLYFTPLLL